MNGVVAACYRERADDRGCVLSFGEEPLHHILIAIRQRFERGDRRVSIAVPHPELGRGLYPGETTLHQGVLLRHRPLRVWLDLADRLGCRLSLPRAVSDTHIRLDFEPLDPDRSWHDHQSVDATEKYGAGSVFQRIDKLEEASFLLDLLEALERVRLQPADRVLDLGVNSGGELAVFDLLDTALSSSLSFVGVDHSRTALALARERFPSKTHTFLEADLNDLDELELGRFDLVISIGTLQSPGIDDRALLRSLVQRHLVTDGSLILGFPNSRYLDGELLYGAKMKNFSQPELSLLVKDLAFYRKYLHQHKFKVLLTGKYDLFVTAVPVRR
ncbi:MAG: class I SAM-dependent methyltransferase [Trueperaceae bacterium]|nr:MAG: class I SAM-dependent methyltransferase [Trueperaceae bacterium]